MDHFNPGFLNASPGRSAWRFIKHSIMQLARDRAGTACLTGPIGAAQAGICQPGEGTKDHQIEGQKQGEQCQQAQPSGDGAFICAPRSGQRPERHRQSHDHQAQGRTQIVEILCIHVQRRPGMAMRDKGSTSGACVRLCRKCRRNGPSGAAHYTQ